MEGRRKVRPSLQVSDMVSPTIKVYFKITSASNDEASIILEERVVMRFEKRWLVPGLMVVSSVDQWVMN